MKEHYGCFYLFKDEQLLINSTDSLGVYSHMIEQIVEQLDICIAKFGRVLVVRFDLSCNEYSDDNHNLSTFINRQKQRIKRTYGSKFIGHAWAREVEKAKHQHYHVALFLHGGDIQNPSKLLRQIKAKWFKYGRVWVPKKKLKTDRGCFYYIDKNNHDEERAETIHRLSYLAKTRGKGYKDIQAKNYSVSRLKLNFKNNHKK